MRLHPSFSLRRQEHLVSWALAAAALWIQVVHASHDWSGWAMSLVAACTAGWASTYAHAPLSSTVVRAFLLTLASAFWPLIHADPVLIQMFWLLAVTGFYALLLQPHWLGLQILAGITSLGIGWAMRETSFALAVDTLQNIGLYVVAAITLWRVGKWVRALDAQVDASMIDPRTRLYNTLGFFNYGQILLEDALRSGKPFTLVLINCEGLREATVQHGKRTARLLLKQLIGTLKTMIPATAIASRTESTEFALALPGLSADDAQALVTRELGSPPVFELSRGRVKIRVTVDVFMAQARMDSDSLEKIHVRLHEQLLQARLAPEDAESQNSLLVLIDDIRAYPRKLDFVLPD